VARRGQSPCGLGTGEEARGQTPWNSKFRRLGPKDKHAGKRPGCQKPQGLKALLGAGVGGITLGCPQVHSARSWTHFVGDQASRGQSRSSRDLCDLTWDGISPGVPNKAMVKTGRSGAKLRGRSPMGRTPNRDKPRWAKAWKEIVQLGKTWGGGGRRNLRGANRWIRFAPWGSRWGCLVLRLKNVRDRYRHGRAHKLLCYARARRRPKRNL
jgi:hypothetical protein